VWSVHRWCRPGQDLVETALAEAAIDFGLDDEDGPDAVAGTIVSGITSGAAEPRRVPPAESSASDVVIDQSGSHGVVRDSTSTKEFDEAFWSQRPILAAILAFFRSRGAAPYAVLAVTLRRAIALVPPSVQLPPIVGDNASVNLLTVAVGRSGQCKDVAGGVGRRAVHLESADGLPLEDPESFTPGSGEGLARIFKGYSRDDVPPTADLVEVNEVSTLHLQTVREQR
jgi:hypothetical protein